MIEQLGRSCILMVCSFVLLTVAEGHGQAGGLSLPETGGPIDGTAQAGSAAVARDAQTSRLNPAGMTRLERIELLGSFQPFLLDFEFNPSPSVPNDGGNQGGWLPNGAVYLAAPLNQSVAVGFSVTAPAGLQLDPDDDWVMTTSARQTSPSTSRCACPWGSNTRSTTIGGSAATTRFSGSATTQ